MTPTATRLRLEDLDPRLGPILRRHDASDASRAALAVAVGALHHGLPIGFTRLWLRSRGGTTRFGYVTSTRQAWRKRIVTRARRRYAASSPGGAGVVEMRLRVARALVAHLLSPLPEHRDVSPAAQINARRVLAAVATGVMDSLASERPMDTALVSTKNLAVDLGLSEGGCRDALRSCVKAKWLSVVVEPRGSSKRYRLNAQLNDALDEVAWRYADTVDALTDGLTEPLADLIRAVDHPAIGYHSEGATAGAKGWLHAVADMADMPATALGLSPGVIGDARDLWRGLLSADVNATLTEDLDMSAAKSDALERYAERRARRTQAAAERTAEARSVRKRREKIRTVVERLLTEHPAPRPGAHADEYNTFEAALYARLVQQPPPDDWRRDLSNILARELVKRGYEQPTAQRVAADVAGLDTAEASAT